LSLNDKVNDWVDNAIYQEDRKRVQERFYCSAMGMCPRKLYFMQLNPKPITKELRRIFELGNIIHEFIERVFKDAEGVTLLDSERSLIIAKPGSPVVLAGRLDNFILVQDTDEEIIVEVKSIKSFKYLTKPKPEHIMQLMPYLKAMNLKKGALVYVNKMDLAVKVFEIDYDEDLVIKAFDKAEMIYNAIVNKTPPEKIKLAERWQCSYCDYELECGEVEETHEKSNTI